MIFTVSLALIIAFLINRGAITLITINGNGLLRELTYNMGEGITALAARAQRIRATL